MYKAKITLDLTFAQFVQSKNYLDDAVPYYKYESNGFTTCHIFGQTIQKILTHSVFSSFSNILEVLIIFEDNFNDYDIEKDPADLSPDMPDMHDCNGIFDTIDDEDPADHESSENTMINHTGYSDLFIEHLIHNLNS